jgi:hypothetical protein
VLEVFDGATNAAAQRKTKKLPYIGTLVRRTTILSNKLPVISRKSNNTP